MKNWRCYVPLRLWSWLRLDATRAIQARIDAIEGAKDANFDLRESGAIELGADAVYYEPKNDPR